MNLALQFHCPACGTTLAVPMAAAGRQGPCPRCAEIITAPLPQAPRPSVAPPMPPAPPPPPPPVAPVKAPATGLQGGAFIAILVLSCLLASALCFGGGFLLGRLERLEGPLPPPAATTNAKAVENPTNNPPEAGPSASIPANPPPRQQQVDGPEAAVTVAGGKPTVESIVEPDTPEGAALMAFLTAPGWASRSAHVLTPDRVSEAMAAHAAKHGDGPIRFDGVSILQDSGKSRVFLVRTPAIPDGFPVVLSESGNGGWLVDWEGFIEFHDDAFRKFADKSPSGQQTFRLLVNPATLQADADGVIKYRLSPPMPARERVARVEDGSTSHARLREIFGAQEKSDPQTYRSLMADRGLPLMVTVSKRPTQGGSQLWIERVIAAGWNPANPPNPDSE